MNDSASPLPTHLDFTTLYAAALALSSDDRKKDGLPLSRLLALSQLIESIVLYDSLQYELGETPDWKLYRDKLENSIISRLAPEFGVPLLPAPAQVDAEESSLLLAMKGATKALRRIPLDTLFWAVQLRSGTYAAVKEVSDVNNPFTKRYLELARSDDDSAFQEDLQSGMAILDDNEIGVLGFHVLVRLLLHESHWVLGGRANYYPHFSRQPLMVVLGDAGFAVEKWTMSELEKARNSIIQRISKGTTRDDLAKSLSPIFLACLARAKFPEDLIDEANKLRNSAAAAEYRRERDNILAVSSSGDLEALMRYQARISLRLNDLSELLFEQGEHHVYERQRIFRFLPGLNFGWTFAMKRTQRVPIFPGDRAAVFLGDIVSQSLGVIQSAEKIREVFGTSATYDTRILGLTS